ncbi:nuclease [Rhodobacteraceae bacterium 4F10]|nr:nuclease [Rhodobacteraceae bacterium 4F10]
MILLISLLLALSSPAFAAEPPTLSGRASVIDGDTIDLHGTRIRLHGIDAPESGQRCQDAKSKSWRCGQKAAWALDHAIDRQRVTCRITDKDRYDRLIGTCSVGDTDLNGWMVQNGWAVAYRKYSNDYTAHERYAQNAELGLWQGSFVRPDKWRNGERLEAHTPVRATQQSGNCNIKGNISSKGARIYHMPGTKWYSRTKISERYGERWFCSEADARNAGWRRAR